MVGARVNIRVKYRLAEDTIGKRLLERDPRAKACLHGQHDRGFYNFSFYIGQSDFHLGSYTSLNVKTRLQQSALYLGKRTFTLVT